MPTDEAIVLAGGLGTRLRGVVSDVPKPLAPVAGKPFLEWILQGLAEQGMRRCILATGYMADSIRSRIGEQFGGMALDYSVEPEPLGTGGAIALAAQRLSYSSAHVVNGDTFLRYDPHTLELLARRDSSLGMALAHVDDVARYGAVELQETRIRAFTEKGGHGPGWINAGCYFLDETLLAALPAGKFSFEDEVLRPRVQAGQVVALTGTSGFIDIGVPEDFMRAQTLFGTPT